MRCAVRRASAITVIIGLTPGAVGNADASPIQTPPASWSSPRVSATLDAELQPIRHEPIWCAENARVSERSDPISPRKASKSSPSRQRGPPACEVTISLAPASLCIRASSTCPSAEIARSTGSSRDQCTTAAPGAEHRPHAGAERRALDEVAASVDGACPIERNDRLHLSLPTPDRLVVDPADEVRGMHPQVMADGRTPRAGAKQERGRLDAAGCDDNRRRFDLQRRAGAVWLCDHCVDPGGTTGVDD